MDCLSINRSTDTAILKTNYMDLFELFSAEMYVLLWGKIPGITVAYFWGTVKADQKYSFGQN